MQQSFEEEMKEQEEEQEEMDESDRLYVGKNKLDSCDLICHHFDQAGRATFRKHTMDVLEDLEISIPKEERGTRSHPKKRHPSGDIFLDNAVQVLKALVGLFSKEAGGLVSKGEYTTDTRVYLFNLKSADIDSILNDLNYDENDAKIATPTEVYGAIRDRLMENYVISTPLVQNECEFIRTVDVIGKCARWNKTINCYAISENLMSEEDVKINCSNYAVCLRKGDAINFNSPALLAIERRLNRIVSEFPFQYPHEIARRERNANSPEDIKTNCTEAMESMSLQEHCPIYFEIILLTVGSYCDVKEPDIEGNLMKKQKFKYSLNANAETVHDIIENIRKWMQESITIEFNLYKQTGRGYLPLTIKGFTIQFSTFPILEIPTTLS